MTIGKQLSRRVRELADGTPYVVEDTEKGFDVRLDLVDAKWHALMSKKGLSRVFVHHVAVDEERRTMTITDDMRTVKWRAGLDVGDGVPVPTLSGSVQRVRGRVYERSTTKVFAWDEQGQLAEVVSYRLDSSEGHALVRTAAEELGLDERMGAAQKVGVVFAVVGAAAAVVTVVAVLVALALGAF